VTLAAAAVGASPRAFYRRKKQCPAFAREGQREKEKDHGVGEQVS